MLEKQPDDSRTLNDQTATEIRDEYAQGKTVRQLSNEFGIRVEIINDVIKRVTYGHVR